MGLFSIADCNDGGTLKRNSMDEKEEEGNITNPNIYEITFYENSVEVQGLICKLKMIGESSYLSPHHYNLNER